MLNKRKISEFFFMILILITGTIYIVYLIYIGTYYWTFIIFISYGNAWYCIEQVKYNSWP